MGSREKGGANVERVGVEEQRGWEKEERERWRTRFTPW